MAHTDEHDDPWTSLDQKLDQIQVKHMKMAKMAGEYRELLDELQDRPYDREGRQLARRLPGARYWVATTYVNDMWVQIEADLKKLFPDEES